MTLGTVLSLPAPLFKKDAPRRIDRVIDYFGASARRDHPRIHGRRIRIATAEVDER